MSQREVIVYIDVKSPYAYLAIAPALALEVEYGVRLTWRPYILDIPCYLGSVEARNDHQWRRVRYSYMDARRLANRRGLVVLGPQKIFDSRLAAIGMLFAQRQGVFPAYRDIVFDRFWKRRLDIEDVAAIAGVLRESGADIAGFADYAAGEGQAALDAIIEEAHGMGVFGVPMFVLDGELFWGGDSMPLLRERLHTTTPRADGLTPR